ncbi:hypothetical protein Q5741_00845 [Paenibacillus sp. JX-17]|uniref:Phage phiEco32-like COOH-NH2 ligase-type 2 n=1 Tax=Paenibacillus lacisoli TaxID=3064525 RepID=A0ABT9C6S3_9BACL|nr:hypothetical protein [Paenibacillus sp. JX-17]MDO7904956.1 hypothetical protein [Paenibacillus sp. JX-17]
MPCPKGGAVTKLENEATSIQQFRNWSMLEKKRRLERSGIPVRFGRNAVHSRGLTQHYVIQTAHFRTLQLVRVMHSAGRVTGREEMSLEQELPIQQRRMIRMAIKALYTLGLDAGEVRISAVSDGKYAVHEIMAEPWKEDAVLKSLYLKAVKEHAEELQHEMLEPAQLLIGMDPEFVLVRDSDRKIVPASRFLDRFGQVGCDAVIRGGRRSYPIAELRPIPSRDPRGLLHHLVQTLSQASGRITDRTLIWQAGSMPQRGLPLGGHIHFSGVLLTGDLLRALDHYLALPVSLLEDRRGVGRRPKYGVLGDYRSKSYGGFEYRTLPSFLVSPLLAKGVIGLAYLIAGSYRQLKRRDLDQEELHRAYYEGDPAPLRAAAGPILQDLRSLKAYAKYESYIEPLLQKVESGSTWDETRDIRSFWKLPTGP